MAAARGGRGRQDVRRFRKSQGRRLQRAASGQRLQRRASAGRTPPGFVGNAVMNHPLGQRWASLALEAALLQRRFTRPGWAARGLAQLVFDTGELLALLSEDGALEERELGFDAAHALLEGEVLPLEPFGSLTPLALVRLGERCHLSGKTIPPVTGIASATGGGAHLPGLRTCVTSIPSSSMDSCVATNCAPRASWAKAGRRKRLCSKRLQVSTKPPASQERVFTLSPRRETKTKRWPA
ncbi:hypothetical protein SAMN05443572_102980 [Myxococcus fulvus]|uniref:Uncharacterized protein n=1 Tax=Myxococcus fulvus TaxID=33 RepID=A0ABY1C4C5_MYXFU|nr:hypothetical protein SAMN05443572_102980 [Myxococcus fulvus]